MNMSSMTLSKFYINSDYKKRKIVIVLILKLLKYIFGRAFATADV